MLLSHERSLHPGLVGAGVIVPVAGSFEADILIVRHQLNIQRRQVPKKHLELLARSLSAGLVDRHSRPPDVFPLTLAKRLRRTVDRFNLEGMH
jgi:hypothetical protein